MGTHYDKLHSIIYIKILPYTIISQSIKKHLYSAKCRQRIRGAYYYTKPEPKYSDTQLFSAKGHQMWS